MYRVQGTLREWVTRDEVRRFIAKKFKEFLLTYHMSNTDEDIIYVRQINEMVLGKMSPEHTDLETNVIFFLAKWC